MSQILIPTINSDGDINRVWVYFKRCDGDASKVKCILCSTELCNIGTEDSLWSHVESIHSIGRNISSDQNYQRPSDETSKQKDERNTDPNLSQLKQPIMTPATDIRPANRANIADDSNANISKNTGQPMINNNNHHSYNYNHDENHLFKNSQKTSNPISKHRHSYDPGPKHKGSNHKDSSDYIDYNGDLIKCMMPSPSSSISKNLISRLNQLSLPVTRKLKFWNKKSFQVNQYDPSFKVIYLGNLGMQLWSKDESCLDKPLGTLWNNYLVNMKTEIVMRLTICNSGLKAITRQHGLTQYWSNRLIFCCSHRNYPRIFSWVYRHEGKKMRQELRCHAVFCSSPEKAAKMVTLLNQRLVCALEEFKREKKSNFDTVIGFSNNSSNSPLQIQKLPRKIPLRRQILTKGSANFRPPLERSKSAPKLTSILEEEDSEENESQDEFEFAESFGEKDDEEEEEDRVGRTSEGSNRGIKLYTGRLDHEGKKELSQNEFIQITSANIQKNGSTSSSLEQDELTANKNQQQISDRDSNLSQTDISSETKSNNNIGNMGKNLKQQPLDDKAAQEILRSWSNFVIK